MATYPIFQFQQGDGGSLTVGCQRQLRLGANAIE
jgi:hypothetical protein